MKIIVTSIPVDEQEKALRFYTETLGFIKKTDIPMGDYRWLTVVSPDAQEGVELLLEPTAFAPAKVYQKALFDAGIPATIFGIDNIEDEYNRLLEKSVNFKMGPTQAGPVKIAQFEDGCGNLIQMVQR